MTRLACGLLLLAHSAGLLAQDQVGGLAGRAISREGTGLAGVLVEIDGPAGKRSLSTDEDGAFDFPRLLPGEYEITVSCGDCGSVRPQRVRVELGRTTRLELLLEAGPHQEAITVLADGGGTLHSARTYSVQRGEIADLPYVADFALIAGQLPSASPEIEAGGISVDGASGSENRFAVDGVDTTHPQTGVSGKALATAFLEEVQLKSAGYKAKYGGATGGVITAVTRSGDDRWTAELGLRYSSSHHDGAPRPVQELGDDRRQFRYRRFPNDDEDRLEPWAIVSGPLAEERAWFFLGYDRVDRATERTVHFATGEVVPFERREEVGFLTANVSGRARPDLFWRLAANLSPSEHERSLPDPGGTGSREQSDYRFGSAHDNVAYSFNVDWVARRRWLIGARGGYFGFDSRTTNGEVRDFETVFGGTPALFPDVPEHLLRPAGFFSAPRYTLTRWDRFRRTAFSADAAVSFQAFGRHELETGFQAERVANEVLRTGNAALHFFAWDRRDPFFGERGRYGYLHVENPATAGDVRSDNLALFVQDSWSPRTNLTLHLGLRAEEETIPDYRLGHEGDAAIHFGFEDKLAPRVGFAWNPGGDPRLVIYGSWGKYFDVTKYQLARTSFGAERRVIYYYRLDDYDWTRVRCTVESNDPALVPDCGLPPIGAVNLRVPSNESIDPSIRPMESCEWQLGVDRRLGHWTLGARYLHKEVVRAIEDIGAFDPARSAEIFTIGNPGEGNSRFALPGLELPRPVRDYDAFELTAENRVRDRWMVRASYTYSRLWGNYPGLASSDEGGRNLPNILRIYDAWFTQFDQRGEPVHGRLGTDRPHQLELQGIYRWRSGMTLGLYQYAGSGTPRSTTASRQGIFFFPYGRGDMGRNPTLMQTDLRLGYERRIGGGSVELSVSVSNLFDEDAVTDVSELVHFGDIRLTDDEFRNGFDLADVLEAQGLLRNPAYGHPVAFQAPRLVWLALALRR